ncbi:MAG: hypothetical protein RIQ60_2678 [Pseudomonadota bacterium]|jgi:hypothetical protein
MHSHIHSLSQLFAQLGLPEDAAAVEAFISSHRPLPGHLPLAEAPFWSPAQAEMLAGGVADDADWAEVVDTLDSLLRH